LFVGARANLPVQIQLFRKEDAKNTEVAPKGEESRRKPKLGGESRPLTFDGCEIGNDWIVKPVSMDSP